MLGALGWGALLLFALTFVPVPLGQQYAALDGGTADAVDAFTSAGARLRAASLCSVPDVTFFVYSSKPFAA